MSLSCTTTNGSADTPERIISRSIPQLPGEILSTIGEACVEPFSIAVQDHDEGDYFDVTGYPKIKNIALASSHFNVGVQKGLQSKFSRHLEWASHSDLDSQSLNAAIPLPWLIAQISTVNMDQGNDRWYMPHAHYHLFPNLRIVTLYTCCLLPGILNPVGLITGHYDQLVFSECARLWDNFDRDQQQAGGFWPPDRDGRKLQVVGVFKYAEMGVVKIVVDISKPLSPVVVDRRIINHS